MWKYLNSLRSDLNVENLEQYYLSKYSENYEGYKVAINELKYLVVIVKKSLSIVILS